ncbi:MAG: phosphoribosylaminoimidazolesuccinocarboxamide synthase [Deltaproteobacteria bacterium]|nr:phosphoribosylaminoimidazolesuccinocarboxamide synthase [Deltaproteobacteria bacterium]MBW2361665.1 phosphoribosylaminoimidazolesuccinocarboxamide synthase [Deltaproteobacteria bacterium]
MLLQKQCQRTLVSTELTELGRLERGKVRDSYVTDDKRRYIVVSDRVSCFDIVVGTLPFKGQVLNQIAAFWFEQTREIAPNHLIEVPDPNVSLVREVATLPVEFVVRGYLTGASPTSIWTAYDRGKRVYCGHRLPEGMQQHEPLPEPLLTPTTKAPKGSHDELISREQLIESGSISEELYDAGAAVCSALFAAGQAHAAQRGLILVDTKYELGVDLDGNIVVIDEIHTPDSSRYWYRDRYERALAEGHNPEALDKEYVRRWLIERGWSGKGTQPELTLEVRCEAARRYIEAYEQITGTDFKPDTEPSEARIRRNLGV